MSLKRLSMSIHLKLSIAVFLYRFIKYKCCSSFILFMLTWGHDCYFLHADLSAFEKCSIRFHKLIHAFC